MLPVSRVQHYILLHIFSFSDVLLTVNLSIFISVIKQLDAQNFCFTIIFFLASTCFEHMRSSSGGQNCITQLSQPVHETATYRCDDTRGCVMQFWPPDDEHMCSKLVEARNKLIVKQKFCASSWLITEIITVWVVSALYLTLCLFVNTQSGFLPMRTENTTGNYDICNRDDR